MLQQITFENKNKNSSNPLQLTLTDQNINQIKARVNDTIDYLNTHELFIISGFNGDVISLSTFITRTEFNNLSSQYYITTQQVNNLFNTLDQVNELLNTLPSIETYVTQYDFINTLKNYTLKVNTLNLSGVVSNLLYQFQNNIYFKNDIDDLLNNYYSKNNTYNKSQIDNLLNNYCLSVQIQNLISNYNTKSEISQIISAYCLESDFLQICSNIFTIQQLQDYLNLNYYSKEEIDSILNFSMNQTDVLSSFYKKIEIDNLLNNYITENQLNITLGNYYNKTQISELILTYLQTSNPEINISLDNYYNKDEIDDKFKNILTNVQYVTLMQKLNSLTEILNESDEFNIVNDDSKYIPLIQKATIILNNLTN